MDSIQDVFIYNFIPMCVGLFVFWVVHQYGVGRLLKWLAVFIWAIGAGLEQSMETFRKRFNEEMEEGRRWT